MTPMPRLLDSISLIREQFPDLPLYSFMDAFRPQAKSQTDFELLAAQGLGLILMVGVGGQRFAETHRQASVEWLKALAPDQRDLVFLSEFVPHPDQPYTEKAAHEGVTALSAAALEAEVQAWRQALKGIGAKIVPYHLQEFIY